MHRVIQVEGNNEKRRTIIFGPFEQGRLKIVN